jgi:HKD family nuclease
MIEREIMEIILQPFSTESLGDLLKLALSGQDQGWTSFQAAIAFVKRSGVQHIESELQAFIERSGYVRIVVGIDQYGTSQEGLSSLLTIIGDKGEIWINHESNHYITFHPKVYLFEREKSALLIVGSGNLTQGGLYTNDEASLIYELDLLNQDDQLFLEEVKNAFDSWCNDDLGNVKQLDEALLKELIENDYLRSEEKSRTEDEAEEEVSDQQAKGDKGRAIVDRTLLFGRGTNRRRPPVRSRTGRKERVQIIETTVTQSDQVCGFVMTLMRTDVGSGQTTPGTSRRSPEVFIPLTARNRHPEFWNWPDAFSEDPSKPGKFDRVGVLMRIGGEVISVNMMTWPDKHDFRLRSEAL